jgi:hypothetical protein
MNTSNRSSCWLALASLLALLSVAACGDDTGGGTSGGGSGDPSCGTVDDPEIFQLADVTPAAGSVADGLSVVHSFRVVDASVAVNQLAFQVAATHTAGTPTPAQLTFTVTQDGKDLVYTANAVEWANAGHVELSIPATYQGQDGCAYAFAAPIFSYDVEASDGTGGGSTGSNGATGSTGAGGEDAAGGAAP